MYYNYDKLLSYNAMLSFVIAERGVGKTFGAKDYCISRFKKKKSKFAWIRRFANDLDEAIGTHKDKSFFKALIKENYEKYKNDEFDISENKKGIKTLYINDCVMGYGMNLKSAESLKGTEYNDVDTIIFDEFLVGEGGSHYIKNEVKYFLSIIDTIARLRKIRVICLGNATQIWNPYFEYLKLHIPYNSEFQTFKNGEIVVNYAKNLEFRKARKQTAFGKIIEGTDYEKYAIDNIFSDNNDDFIEKKPIKASLLFNMSLNNKNLGVWLSHDKMYISNKHNIDNNILIAFDYENHDSKTMLVKANSVFIKNMVNFFQIGRLYFENQNIKFQVIDLLTKLRQI